MSFNDIQLPGFVIADLYKNSVVAGIGDTVPVTAQPKGYAFLGDNARNIAIIVNEPGVVFLTDEGLLLITKMLEACKINMGDVAILNQAVSIIAISKLKTQLQPSTLILFGLEPTVVGLPFNIPAFKIQDYDGCKYLYVPALENLLPATEEAKLLKSKLWVCLRSLFQV